MRKFYVVLTARFDRVPANGSSYVDAVNAEGAKALARRMAAKGQIAFEYDLSGHGGEIDSESVSVVTCDESDHTGRILTTKRKCEDERDGDSEAAPDLVAAAAALALYYERSVNVGPGRHPNREALLWRNLRAALQATGRQP